METGTTNLRNYLILFVESYIVKISNLCQTSNQYTEWHFEVYNLERIGRRDLCTNSIIIVFYS